jgi:hypothetical protein
MTKPNVVEQSDLVSHIWVNLNETQKVLKQLEVQRLQKLELAAQLNSVSPWPVDQIRNFLNEADSLRKTIKFLKGEK